MMTHAAKLTLFSLFSFILTMACKPNQDSFNTLQNMSGDRVTPDHVTLDENLNPSELYKALSPMPCHILEKGLGGREQTYGCAVVACNSNDVSEMCRQTGKKSECRPGSHVSMWKEQTSYVGQGAAVISFEFKPDVYVVPLEVSDARATRRYWVNYELQRNPQKVASAGISSYMCVPTKSGPQTLTRQSMGENSTYAMMAQATQETYEHMVMLTRIVPGVNVAIEIDMCRAGEISCWEAAFTAATNVVDFALPVGMAFQGMARAGQMGASLSKVFNNAAKTGRQITVMGNIASGGVRSSQAFYAGYEGDGVRALFLGAEAVLRFTVAGALSLRSVSSKIDEFGSLKGTNSAGRADDLAQGVGHNPCFGLVSSCTLPEAKATASAHIQKLRNLRDEVYEEAVYEAWDSVLKPVVGNSKQANAYNAIDNMIAERIAYVLKDGGTINDMMGAAKVAKMSRESAEILLDAVKAGDTVTLVRYGYIVVGN